MTTLVRWRTRKLALPRWPAIHSIAASYFEHMPTSDAQHERFRSAHRLTKIVVRKLNPTTEGQATLADMTGAMALAGTSVFAQSGHPSCTSYVHFRG
jgi:hypothetical protein